MSASNRAAHHVPLAVLVTGLAALVAGGATLTVSGQAPGAPGGAPADLILTNGRFITVDRTFSRADAVAIANGRFVAVGTAADVARLAGPSTRTIDLHGRSVVPGLGDNHLHNAGGGPGIALASARTLDDVYRAIRARVGQSEPGELLVSNSDWHEAQLTEHRLPLRRDLDRVAPVNPVVLIRGGHEYILNSAALRKWNITEQTPEPSGGRISRYEDGTLNGELVDRARNLVTLPPPPPRTLEERIAAQAAEYRTLHAAGLTSVRHPGISPDEYRVLQEMQKRGLLTMRVNALLRPDRDLDAPAVTAYLENARLRPDEGDEWLRIGGVKLAIDGGFEGGFMRDPYLEPWGEGGKYRGLQTVPAPRYTAIVRAINAAGWRVATHAVGDAAIDQVLDAYEAADRDRSIRGRRWAIEHAFIARPDHFPRMKRLELAISAQDHLYLAGPSLLNYWGAARTAIMTPMRAFIDQGLMVSAGTDSAVVPYPPLWVLYHFITRDTISGGVIGPEQRITREEALRASTMGVAWLTFEEATKGSIETGKLADLVVLSEDILTCPEERIESARVLLTMVGGRVVYADQELAAEAPR